MWLDQLPRWKTSSARVGSVCGKMQRRLLQSSSAIYAPGVVGFYFYSIINQSINSPQKVKHPKLPQSSTASPPTHPLFVLLSRGDIFRRGWRKKGAGCELELKEVGRRNSGRVQLYSMAREQNTAEWKNHDTREHHW